MYFKYCCYDSCVFIGHPDWRKVEKGSIVDINGGGTILTPMVI